MKLAGTGSPQTMTGTGGLKTDGLLESAGGVRISGGSGVEVQTGLFFRNGRITASTVSHDGDAAGLNVYHIGDGDDSTIASSLRITRGDDNGSTRADYRGIYIRNVQATISGQKGYGLFTEVNTSPGTENYNIYCAGTASNFLKTSVYIGGTTARNTFEAWLSTLTEEQIEKYRSGKIVAPADVTEPGDGKWMRQWWYDQQTPEDQALIDAGELAYPTNLLPENFVDNFALGQYTNINLLSGGNAEFKGDILCSDNSKGLILVSPNKTQYRLIVANDGTLSTSAV